MVALARFMLVPLVTLLCASVSRAQPVDLLQNSTAANRFLSAKDGTVYVIRANTLLRLTDSRGVNWQEVATQVEAAAIDPQNVKIIYVIRTTLPRGRVQGARNYHIMKSLDAGKKWLDISNGIPQETDIASIFVGQNGEDLWAGTEGGLYKSNDGGFSWQATTLKGPVTQFYPSYALVRLTA